MAIGDRLRALREHRNLSQGDIQKRTGLLRCYVSRVENGHTSPSIESSEKFARALGVPMFQLFYDGEQPPAKPVKVEDRWGSTGHDARALERLRRLLRRTSANDLNLLLFMGQKMANNSKR
jgi:transcriptional regulator with XRE-family HTH domain